MSIFRMNFSVEKLKVAIERGTWKCDALADSHNFYRMLFKLEKQKKITEEEVHTMLASYENWKVQIEELVGECDLNNTDEDKKAVLYAEQLEEDIMLQIYHIVTKVPCEKEGLVAELNKLADKME